MICIKSCSPLTAFSITTEKFVEFKEKTSKVIECQRGRLSALNPMEIFIAMLIKVRVVYILEDFENTSLRLNLYCSNIEHDSKINLIAYKSIVSLQIQGSRV